MTEFFDQFQLPPAAAGWENRDGIDGIGRPRGSDGTDPIAARLDALPVTPLHWAILVVCALGLFFDVVEAGLSNALSAVFSAPPHRVPARELSFLLASVFAGGAVGAPLLGWFADRHGRRLALGIALLVLTVTSLLAAASSDVFWLTVCRALSGFALGAYPPLIVAYLSDVSPPAQRGRMILICGAIGFLGAPAVVFLIRWLTPLAPLGIDGWRWALVIGAVGCAAVGLAFRWLPESPRWLASVRARCRGRGGLPPLRTVGPHRNAAAGSCQRGARCRCAKASGPPPASAIAGARC